MRVLLYQLSTERKVDKVTPSCIPQGLTFSTSSRSLNFADAAFNGIRWFLPVHFSIELPSGVENPDSDQNDEESGGHRIFILLTRILFPRFSATKSSPCRKCFQPRLSSIGSEAMST